MTCSDVKQKSEGQTQTSGKEVTLDLRWRGNIGREYTKAFNRIALDNHNPFIEFISTLSRQFGSNIDWWTENVSSRNTFSSPLFYRICASLFLQQALKSGSSVKEITVDSPAHLQLIKGIIGESLPGCRVSLIRGLKGLAREKILPIAVAIKYLFLWFLVRALCRKKGLPDRKDLILIDTFVLPGFEQEDRYYPGLWEAVAADERDRVWFVPTFHGYSLHQLPRAVMSLRDSERQWMFREEQISLGDLLFAFGHKKRVKKFAIAKQVYKGLNITPLVMEELRANSELGSAVLGLLNYCCFKRMRERGLDIVRTIDWSENQVVDKGWNAGVGEYYPNAFSLGYQGYAVTPHYLVMYPTEVERGAGVLPKELAVIGSGFAQPRVKYAPTMAVRVAPAFRFAKIHKFHGKTKREGKYVILVALPKLLDEAVDILSVLQGGVLENTDSSDIEWWVKMHPAHNLGILGKVAGGIQSKLKLRTEPFDELVLMVDLVISTASSVCLEAIAYGTPVIIDAGSKGLVHNPIPDTVPDDIWSICYTSQDIVDAVCAYRDGGRNKQRVFDEISGMVRRDYFEPVTERNTRDMLGMQ